MLTSEEGRIFIEMLETYVIVTYYRIREMLTEETIMQNYKIVRALTARKLEQKVDDLIREGWEVSGGVTTHRGRLFQALRRPDQIDVDCSFSLPVIGLEDVNHV